MSRLLSEKALTYNGSGDKLGVTIDFLSDGEPILELSIRGHEIIISYNELKKLIQWLVKHATPSKL